MPVHPNDFSLSVEQLRQRYTQKQLEETAQLLRTYGADRYRNNFMELTAPDPGKMDVFSSEYASTVASNIVPSTLSMFTGLADMVFNPIDTAEAMYDLGLEGAVEGLISQYDSWENAKRTFAKDPMGTLGMAAPGMQVLGAAGKAAGVGRLATGLAQGAAKVGSAMPKAIKPMAGLTSRAVQAVSKPMINMAVDPVGAVGSVALKGAQSFMTGGGKAGRIALEFLTGESVQSLEAMQQAGRRLTDEQMRIAGLNPFHWMGEFDDPVKKAEFGTTAYEHFKQARTGSDELGGFKDEAAIIMHLDSVVLKAQNSIVQQNQTLLDRIFKGIEGPEGVQNVLEKMHAGDVKTIIKDSQRREVDALYKKAIGNALIGTEGISIKLVKNLNDKLSHLGLKFRSEQIGDIDTPRMRHDYDILKAGTILTGIDVDGLVNWINKTLNTDLSNLENLKNALVGNDLVQPQQAGLLQKLNQYKGQAGNAEIINAFYDVLREHLDDITPTQMLKNDLNVVLPEAGQLSKMIRDPTDDNLWGQALRMQRFREDIQRDYVSMKNGTGDDAAMLGNYIRTLRDGDSGIKKQLIDELEAITGESIHAGIAGLIARKVTPSSLVARGSAVSAMQRAAVMATGAAAFNPALLAFIPLASPRVVGTMLSTIGLTQRSVDYVKALTRHIGNHPVGEILNKSKRTIWSVGTALDRIQAYNAAQMQQPQMEERY